MWEGRPAARRLCSRRLTDRQANAVGPLDRVVFDDPVVSAGRRDHAELRKRVRVAGVLECEPFYANVSKPPLGGTNAACGWSFQSHGWPACPRQADLDRLSGLLHPEARIGRAADLLHDWAAATTGEARPFCGVGGTLKSGRVADAAQPVRTAVRPVRAACRRQTPIHAGEETAPCRPPWGRAMSAARVLGRRTVVSIWKHGAGECVLPGGDMRLGRPPGRRVTAGWNGHLFPAILQNF